MLKKAAIWLVGVLSVLWLLSLLPDSMAREARSEFVHGSGEDDGVEIGQFSGPRRVSYQTFTWYHVDSEGDSLYVDITVRPYGVGANTIAYRTSTPQKSLEDFPGVTEARSKQ